MDNALETLYALRIMAFVQHNDAWYSQIDKDIKELEKLR
jgi:hypothetical protein